MDKAHDTVDSSAHVVRGESPDEVVKRTRCRTNAEEKWYFNEDEYEARDAAEDISPEFPKQYDSDVSGYLQTYDAKDDDKGDVEQIRDPQSNA